MLTEEQAGTVKKPGIPTAFCAEVCQLRSGCIYIVTCTLTR
jgi:hypothetical protein